MAHGKSAELAKIITDPVVKVLVSGATLVRHPHGDVVSSDGQRYVITNRASLERVKK